MEKNVTGEVVIEEVDVQEKEFTEQELSDDTIDWKAKAIELKGLNQRRATKLAKLKEKLSVKNEKPAEVQPTKIEPKSDELDYGAKAYLKASGIEPTEFEFVKKHIKESGKDIDSLLNSGYFQSELKDYRNAEAVKKATPSSTRLAPDNGKSKVDYWIDRGELPPDTYENRQLRFDIVNARYEREKSAFNRPS